MTIQGPETFPSVGVIVVNWNSNEVLKRCLAALAKLRGPILHTIVIDNASHEALKHLPQPHPPNTELIHFSHNVGFAKANNFGVRQLADCEWVALINPDVFVESQWITCLMEATRRHPNHSFFACQLLQANHTEQLDGAGDAYHASGLAWRWGYGSRVHELVLLEQEVFGARAAAALYRRDVFMEVGGFDEDFFCYFEDVDLAFRLRLAGHKCMLIPGAIAHHVGSATTGGERSEFSVYHGYRNMVWCYVKNMPGLLVWVFLPLHLLMNVASLLQGVFRKQGRVVFRAQWDAVKGLPLLWRKRNQVQNRRVAQLIEIWRILDKGVWPNNTCRHRSVRNPIRKLMPEKSHFPS